MNLESWFNRTSQPNRKADVEYPLLRLPPCGYNLRPGMRGQPACVSRTGYQVRGIQQILPREACRP